jgi:beta-barrel assembly-enhancing protease
MRQRWIVLLLVAALGPVLFAGQRADRKNDPGQIGNRDVGRGINFYSLGKEMAMGRQLAQEVRRQAKLVDDPLVTEYVNRIGQNLVRNSDARVPFTFTVIEAESPNAFAFPGGYVFVHTGLIKMADEEAELAAAMAHEIAHVAARHMTRQATRMGILSFAALPLDLLLGGWAGYGVQQVSGIAGKVTSMKFSRQDESEADTLGLQYLYTAGYDPAAAVTLFEKLDSLERKAPGTLARIFASHPADSARLAKAQREIERYLPARADYVVNTSTYMDVRSRLFAFQSGRKSGERESRPVLRRAPGAGAGMPVEDARPAGTPEPDDRPTIQRRERVE